MLEFVNVSNSMCCAIRSDTLELVALIRGGVLADVNSKPTPDDLRQIADKLDELNGVKMTNKVKCWRV